MTQTAQVPTMVPYEVFQREREKRIQAEKDRDYYKREFFLSRSIRRAPVLKPVDKDVLEEFRHVEKWGKVEDTQGNKRANYTTIAHNLKISPDTVARSAERLEKLGIADIREHQGPKDERERKYIQVKEEQLQHIDKLEDPENVVPKQGGNRYICMNEDCNSTDVAVRKVTRTTTTIHCNTCHHEHVKEEEEDTGWKMQNGHKEQKQLAFKKSIDAERAKEVKASCFSDEQEQTLESEKQLAEHSVYTQDDSSTPQKQLAFQELAQKTQWVVWRREMRKGKPTKVPYNPTVTDRAKRADVTNPHTWGTYEQAQALRDRYDGIGFVFNGDYVGIDIDNYVDKETGEVSELALGIIASIDSYTEISPSGAGVHIIARGSIPAGRRRDGVEMYHSGRFFTITSRHISNTPETIEDAQSQIDDLYADLAAPECMKPNRGPVHAFTCSRSDEQILELARNARNGAKFRALYDGSTAGYHSQSEADLALCRMLDHWTDGNVSTIDRLFRKSGLMRDKWDRRMSASVQETYGERTIRIAIGQGARKAS